MASKDYEPEGDQDHISKLAFSAVAAPDPAFSSGSPVPYEIRDLDQYVAKGPPATRREVISYYAYVRLILIRLANLLPHESRVAVGLSYAALFFCSRSLDISETLPESGIYCANLLGSMQATMALGLSNSMFLGLSIFLSTHFYPAPIFCSKTSSIRPGSTQMYYP
jgi:hypothetical protein